MTAWEMESGLHEVRFALFNVPHVIKCQDQYLVMLQGIPPKRTLIHIAVLKNIRPEPGNEIQEWVKRTGIFGLMSREDASSLTSRLMAWWASPRDAATQTLMAQETPIAPEPGD
jgi:hypothetical protein